LVLIFDSTIINKLFSFYSYSGSSYSSLSFIYLVCGAFTTHSDQSTCRFICSLYLPLTIGITDHMNTVSMVKAASVAIAVGLCFLLSSVVFYYSLQIDANRCNAIRW
jgi:hypothetical protein